MAKTLEQRVTDLEALVKEYAQRQADISHTESKILGIIRQLARIKCAKYYVDEKGCRCLCHPDEARNFQFALEIEISKLGVDLMSTDIP